MPFVTGQFTNTGTATTSPFQTIERKDVGITLRIKPQIGEGGTVRMVIYPEQSSVREAAAVGTSNAGPSTSKRSSESPVALAPQTAPCGRISLSPAAWRQSRQNILLITGASKQAVLQQALDDGAVEQMPVRLLWQDNMPPLSVYWAP